MGGGLCFRPPCLRGGEGWEGAAELSLLTLQVDARLVRRAALADSSGHVLLLSRRQSDATKDRASHDQARPDGEVVRLPRCRPGRGESSARLALLSSHRSTSATATTRFRPRRIQRSSGATCSRKWSSDMSSAAAARAGLNASGGIDALGDRALIPGFL